MPLSKQRTHHGYQLTGPVGGHSGAGANPYANEDTAIGWPTSSVPAPPEFRA
jgi:hypothetical protein